MDEDETTSENLNTLKKIRTKMLLSLLSQKILCLRLEIPESIVSDIEETFNELKKLIYEQMGTEQTNG